MKTDGNAGVPIPQSVGGDGIKNRSEGDFRRVGEG